MTLTASRTTLRKQLRQARRALSPAQQRRAAIRLAANLAQDKRFLRARHMAFYLANDGEIDPTPLMLLARRHRKHCYLPVLQRWPATAMVFQKLTRGQRWQRNRFGIREPLRSRNNRSRPGAWIWCWCHWSDLTRRVTASVWAEDSMTAPSPTADVGSTPAVPA